MEAGIDPAAAKPATEVASNQSTIDPADQSGENSKLTK